MPEEFFSNRELYNMIEDLKKEIADLTAEMRETKTLIREYNGLREKITQTETRLNTLMWVVGVGIPALIAVLMYFRG